jgi:antitoxin MazE
MFADVRRWGNSLAIRIPSEEAEALGIKEGEQVKVRLQRIPKGKVDISNAPVFHDPEGRTDLSERHDDIVYEAIEEKLRRARR